MLKKEDFCLGYAPTRRNVFSREDAIKYKGLVKNKVVSMGYKLIDIDDINEDGLLLSEEDVANTIRKFKEKKVDAVFSPHCNFGCESAVSKVAKETAKPFLLWGPRDEAPLPDGSRLRDSQCGLFATSKILQRMQVPFTYIVNSRIEDLVFRRNLENFIQAANVVKCFKKMRIGQIGVRPGDFWTVICNEGQLLEKFGIEVVPFNLGDVVSMAKKLMESADEEFVSVYNFIKFNIETEIDNESVKHIAALKTVMKSLALEHQIDAFAIQCWTSLQDMFSIVPCLSNALMFDEKIPVACETDIHGAVSSLIAQAATFNQHAVFFADITIRHPEDDNGELLWHCGPFPYSLRKEGTDAKACKHFIMDGAPAGTCSWEITGGNVSVVRFDSVNDRTQLFASHAVGMDGPKTQGTYLWIKVKDWTRWEEKLVKGPYIHHVAGIHGHIAPALYEAVKYIKGVEFDDLEPTAGEIGDWLACRKA